MRIPLKRRAQGSEGLRRLWEVMPAFLSEEASPGHQRRYAIWAFADSLHKSRICRQGRYRVLATPVYHGAVAASGQISSHVA